MSRSYFDGGGGVEGGGGGVIATVSILNILQPTRSLHSLPYCAARYVTYATNVLAKERSYFVELEGGGFYPLLSLSRLTFKEDGVTR